MVFNTDGFFDIAIEIWPEWDFSRHVYFNRRFL